MIITVKRVLVKKIYKQMFSWVNLSIKPMHSGDNTYVADITSVACIRYISKNYIITVTLIFVVS